MQMVDRLIRLVARFGYLARGLVYLMVGGLALQAALDLEEAEDIRGAMYVVLEQEFGVPVLLAIAVGLLAYAAWRVVQSLIDVDGHGFSAKGLVLRVSFLISAGLHATLASASVKIALHIESGKGTPTRAMVENIFTWPLGRWMVVAGGLAITIAGVAHIYKGATGGFLRWFDASPSVLRWIDPVCRVGLVARGILFVLISSFVVYAAITLEANQARGLEGALLWVQQLAFGRLLLGVVGMGLMAFGAYSVIESCVRRVGFGNSEG